jgi:hypothetical protein
MGGVARRWSAGTETSGLASRYGGLKYFIDILLSLNLLLHNRDRLGSRCVIRPSIICPNDRPTFGNGDSDGAPDDFVHASTLLAGAAKRQRFLCKNFTKIRKRPDQFQTGDAFPRKTWLRLLLGYAIIWQCNQQKTCAA